MNVHSMKNARYSIILWILLLVFLARVIGQALVVFFGVNFLPESHYWYSGLLPYPYLLPAQIIIVLIFAKVCLDISKNEGFFCAAAINGNYLLVFGALYFASMVIRLALFGISIPAAFHIVLASFIITLGLFYKGKISERKK